MNIIILIGAGLVERIKTALIDSALGIVVIFLSLIILWLMIELFHLVVSAVSKCKKSEDDKNNTDNPTPGVDTGSNKDEELVAVITAAVSAYLDKSPETFRVVSFKKVRSDAHWNKQ
ncbi:MAG: OadG family protein [Clostridia bacterium]|nr:OadG family protein [Clostridia bacterium]